MAKESSVIPLQLMKDGSVVISEVGDSIENKKNKNETSRKNNSRHENKGNKI